MGQAVHFGREGESEFKALIPQQAFFPPVVLSVAKEAWETQRAAPWGGVMGDGAVGVKEEWKCGGASEFLLPLQRPT